MLNRSFHIAQRLCFAALLISGADNLTAQSPDSLLGPPGVRPESVVREWSAANRRRFDGILANTQARRASILSNAEANAVAAPPPTISPKRAEKLRLQTAYGADKFPPMDQWVELVTRNREIEVAAQGGAKALNKWNPIGYQISNSDSTPRGMGAIADLQFAYDPVQNRTALFLGALGGGLWQQRLFIVPINAPISENLPGAPTVGAFHVGGSAGAQFILVGTGIPGGRGAGSGLYRSNNSGSSWTRVLMDGVHPGVFYEIKASVADPNKVYACTDYGLISSRNGGQTWRLRPRFLNGYYIGCSDFVEVGGSSGGVLLIAYYTSEGQRIFYAAPPSNDTVNFDFYPADTTGIVGSVGRISLSSGNPASSYVYAFVADANNNANGVFRSDAYGLSGWTRVAGALGFGNTMGFYANVVGAAPTDDNVVVAGLVNMYISRNATSASPTWTPIATDVFDQTSIDFVPQAVSPGNTRVVFGNDGGVFVYDWVAQTVNKQENARSMNVQLAMGFNSSMTQSHADRNLLGAGLWDVGTLLINQASPAVANRLTYMTGADGGAIALSSDNVQHLLGSFGAPWSRWRSTNRGISWTQIDNGCASGLIDSPMASPWALALEPTTGYGQRAYSYSRIPADTALAPISWKLFRQDLDAANCSWSVLHAGNLPSDVVTINGEVIVQVANDAAADRVYISKSGSIKIWRLTGSSPNMTVTNVSPPPSVISGDVFMSADRNPGQPRTLYQVQKGLNNNLTLRMSTTAGDSWDDVSGDINAYAFGATPYELIGNPTDLNQLFVATAVGVFRSDDRGLNWTPYNQGLPMSIFAVNLEFDPTASPPRLILGSYGRGFYSREVTQRLRDDVIFKYGFDLLPPF